MSMNYDLNCISHWLPKIEDARFPTPRTIIVKTDIDLLHLLDGSHVEGYDKFLNEIRKACREVGYPCFLRSGHFSGKHSWGDTCFIRESAMVGQHIAAIINEGECANIIGFPWNVWAVRQFIRCEPIFHAFHGCMPITREFRFFVEDGSVTHWQPYWPELAIKGHENAMTPPDWREGLAHISVLEDDEREMLSTHSLRAAIAVGGDWSIDWIQDAGGQWWLTDMAVAADSYRYDPSAT